MNCVLCECDVSEFCSDNIDENVFCKDCGLFFVGPNFDREQDLINWINSKRTGSKFHMLHSSYLCHFYGLNHNTIDKTTKKILHNIVKYFGKREIFKICTTKNCLCCDEAELFNNNFKCSFCGNNEEHGFYLINYIDLSNK